jgi:hypothetical protein
MVLFITMGRACNFDCKSRFFIFAAAAAALRLLSSAYLPERDDRIAEGQKLAIAAAAEWARQDCALVHGLWSHKDRP